MLDKHTLKRIRVKLDETVRLKNYDTDWVEAEEFKETGHEVVKEHTKKALKKNVEALSDAQELLYASGSHGVLIIVQGLDASGKDGLVKHVMSGVNPQGCYIQSFKEPSSEESSHNFLWRYSNHLPQRGKIGIFNRSYYEEVVAVKIHPEWLKKQHVTKKLNDDFWQDRYDDINAFERHLTRNGILILKFFLHVSKKEQKQRLLARLEDPKKYWKYSPSDLSDRKLWPDYQEAYAQAITATNTEWAPWHIIPADFKWSARVLVAEVITSAIHALHLRYPSVGKDMKALMERAKLTLA